MSGLTDRIHEVAELWKLYRREIVEKETRWKTVGRATKNWKSREHAPPSSRTVARQARSPMTQGRVSLTSEDDFGAGKGLNSRDCYERQNDRSRPRVRQSGRVKPNGLFVICCATCIRYNCPSPIG